MAIVKPPMVSHVKQLGHGRSGVPVVRPCMRWWGLGALALVVTLSVVPVADARVNPLVIIQRQIHKANMLVVLDTSGSMTGVPGGQFYYRSEAGVDCDDGYNCRMAGVIGNCVASGKSCYSD
jgi:hypothetical protein